MTKVLTLKENLLKGTFDNIRKFSKVIKDLDLNADKKRMWLSELKSLNDGSFCDSVSMPIDLVGKLVSKEEVEFYDEEKYEPESDL